MSKINSSIDVFEDGSVIVRVTLTMPSGDVIKCSCGAASVNEIKQAGQTALDNVLAIEKMLPNFKDKSD